MKQVTQILLVLFCLPLALQAQDKDDSYYLAGAVPEVDGKVVFTKEYAIPGMQQDEIFERVYTWMDGRLKKNENNSRVVFTDKEKGQVVGTGDEWIVFSSSALSLDRTRMFYQLTVSCQPEKCVLEIGKIRFNYREGKEKYVAEEWITDKYALNKTQTKLIRGLAKWRRKTVDFADDMGKELAEALSANLDKEEKPKEQSTSGPVLITPKRQIAVDVPAQQAVTNPTETYSPKGYEETDPASLASSAIQSAEGKLVIVIGEDAFNQTMMTANSGGSLGKINGKTVVFTILSPEQNYSELEKAERYIVRFYPSGQNEPSLILECSKLPTPTAVEGMPRTYIGEIIKALVKK